MARTGRVDEPWPCLPQIFAFREVATHTDLETLKRRRDDRFAGVDHRSRTLEQHIDDRFVSLGHELLVALRGELVTAVSGHTRR